jgi:hypothetical protein
LSWSNPDRWPTIPNQKNAPEAIRTPDLRIRNLLFYILYL